MPLDLSSLEKAISLLSQGVERYHQDQNDEMVRDGLVQRFEFTYELTHKMLRRYLEFTAASSEEVDHMSFQTLVRTANEQGLLKGDWSKWSEYRRVRGKTSHTYDLNAAREVVALIPSFLQEAQYLYEQIKNRNI